MTPQQRSGKLWPIVNPSGAANASAARHFSREVITIVSGIDISPQDMETCLQVLQQIADSHGTVRRSERFNSLISKLYREGRRRDMNDDRRRQEAEDRALLATTAMVQIQRDAPQAALPPPSASAKVLNRPENCYICKEPYTEVHFFYHLLCPKCAAFNYQMRDLHADLTGRTALVTGGRVKIGFQTVLSLLRDGAK
ncbi:MAG: hypothetical protein M3Y13_02855, partial [Armatimonadota bacterium]|nr:hypothetical protein [Armatimonadota bacterium]